MKKRTQPTKAQQWARKRNWHKGQMLSMQHVCWADILTVSERLELAKVKQILKKLHANWNNNNEESKSNYLKG